MDFNKRDQQGGDHSLNIQAEVVTVNSGLSISHVREIASEIFENNFVKLAGIARETAETRAQQITDQFIQELSDRNPAGVKAAEDPDFQHSLFTVQKEFARCGDKELGDILVDMLVDRSKEEERSLLRIVLNESLAIAPKLNSEQLDILACVFNIGYTRNNNVQDLKTFAEYLTNGVLVFAEPINSGTSNYSHLEFLGCASIRAGTRDYVQILLHVYPAFFSKGYPREAIREIELRDPKILNLHIRCLHNTELIQFGGMDDDALKIACATHGISEESTNELIQIGQQSLMNLQEARELLERICPGLPKFFEDASQSRFSSLELTSVGIAIAHAHSRKKSGFDADLSIWIN